MKNGKKREDISLAGAVFVVAGLFVILAAGSLVLGLDVIVLLAAGGIFTTTVFTIVYGYGLRDLFGRGVAPMISRAWGAMAILMSVGPLIASWTLAGTIPYLVFLGLSVITPEIFLVSAFVVCSVASLVTGTSWGTAATFGVALMGVAEGLGVPLSAAAGAVVGGAYFGDKLSPVSDTTVLAAAVAEVDVMDHVRSMLWTTLPPFIASLLVYAAAGGGSGEIDSGRIRDILSGITGSFSLHPVLLLPPAALLVLSWRGYPTLAALWTAVGIAVPMAFFQGYGPMEIFRAAIAGPEVSTGIPAADGLLNRGGLLLLAGVAAVMCVAYVFAGQLEVTGCFRRISSFLKSSFIGESRGRFVSSVSATGILVALGTGNSYLSEIIPGAMYKNLADEMDISRLVLSRTLEDSGTVVVPLVPWSAAAIYLSAVLGVPPFEYIPWAPLCYLGFITAWILAFAGIAVWPSGKK